MCTYGSNRLSSTLRNAKDQFSSLGNEASQKQHVRSIDLLGGLQFTVSERASAHIEETDFARKNRVGSNVVENLHSYSRTVLEYFTVQHIHARVITVLKVQALRSQCGTMENNVMMRKRRDRLEVIHAILEVAVEGAVKTRIMYRTNVNFRQFEDYVESLLEAGLVEILDEKNRRIYKTTEKGDLLLKRLKETRWIFNEVEGQETVNIPAIRKGQAAYFIRR